MLRLFAFRDCVNVKLFWRELNGKSYTDQKTVPYVVSGDLISWKSLTLMQKSRQGLRETGGALCRCGASRTNRSVMELFQDRLPPGGEAAVNEGSNSSHCLQVFWQGAKRLPVPVQTSTLPPHRFALPKPRHVPHLGNPANPGALFPHADGFVRARALLHPA